MKLMLCRDPLKWGSERIGWIPNSDRLRLLDYVDGIDWLLLPLEGRSVSKVKSTGPTKYIYVYARPWERGSTAQT